MKDQADFPDLEKFAARLRETRKRMKLNQTDFAALGGVGLGSQSRYEKAETQPSAGYLASLARHEVDVRFLLTGERSVQALDQTASAIVTAISRLTDMQRDALRSFLATLA